MVQYMYCGINSIPCSKAHSLQYITQQCQCSKYLLILVKVMVTCHQLFLKTALHLGTGFAGFCLDLIEILVDMFIPPRLQRETLSLWR